MNHQILETALTIMRTGCLCQNHVELGTLVYMINHEIVACSPQISEPKERDWVRTFLRRLVGVQSESPSLRILSRAPLFASLFDLCIVISTFCQALNSFGRNLCLNVCKTCVGLYRFQS